MEYKNLSNKILTIFSTKVLVLLLLIFGLASSSLTASTPVTHDKKGTTNKFEITAAFIATWETKEVRDYSVIEVATTYDFVAAHNIVEKLREIVTEPILVKHGYENDSITYTIIVGRFSNLDEAVAYHNTLR